jgi:primosomal protein N' (replication factor Y)
VPVPGLGLLTYGVPNDVAIPLKGARVRVPLGARTVIGCVVGPCSIAPADGKLRDLVEVIDDEPFVPGHVVDLALWVGEYYASGPGDALALAMPPSARSGRHAPFRTVQVMEPSVHGHESLPRLSDRARAALGVLESERRAMTMAEVERRGVSRAAVTTLVRLGLVTRRRQAVERDPFSAVTSNGAAEARVWTADAGSNAIPDLTSEQSEALHGLEDAFHVGRFSTVLLRGVTGSGKTELYLRLTQVALDAGRRILVLVPEIGLTPVVAQLFRTRFGARVAIQHSGLSPGERHDQWQRIRRGDVDIVIGTRSAVFAPVERVGLIIVDEEHDGSYKQDESPRYHGRDVAVVRARMEGALVVLGSATPSLESAVNARAGRYREIRLTRRVLDRPLATVRIVDMRAEYASGGPDVLLSALLVTAIASRLEKQEQTVLLLNRRGFATVIFCRACGTTLECPHCSVSLTYHRAARRVRCHYCNYASIVPRRCAACRGEFLEQSGFGTERIETAVRERFPSARVARVDRDTVRRRGAFARVLRDVGAGEVDILVGTQMIAKGHDFPAVTLVGVIAADVGLGLADFRASERTFQLLTQVVGRAGRGNVPGEAIIQTLYPQHYSIRAAADQDYAAFFDREIEFRTAMRYPPVVALVNVIVRGRSLDAAMADAATLATEIRRHTTGVRVLGPAPAALSKVKDEYRVQILVKSMHRRVMRDAVQRALDDRPDLKRRTIVDVDPMTVL